MDIKDKWIYDYIKDIDLSNIKWVKFNVNELDSFYQENYLDKDVWQYVYTQNNSSFISPLGLHYLAFDYYRDEYNFLLGIVDNNVGKKTIVAAMVYLENYYLFENQNVPLTYISTIETNLYFWNKGIYKNLCEVVINFINPNQHVLISRESVVGEKHHVVKKLKDALVNNGFEKTIWIDDDRNYMNPEFYNMVCSKKRVLK